MSTSSAEYEADNAVSDGSPLRLPPRYTIIRGADYSLVWDPPIKSRGLADALSYRYPMEQTLRQKMQRATLDFFRAESMIGHSVLKDDERNSNPTDMIIDYPATPRPPDILPTINHDTS